MSRRGEPSRKAPSHGEASQARSEGGARAGGAVERWLVGGAAALLVATPLAPTEAADEGIALPVSLGWLLLLAIWTGAMWRGRAPARMRLDATLLCWLAACGWLALSAFVRGPVGDSRAAANMGWTWIGSAAALVVLWQLAAEAKRGRLLATVAFAGALGLALHGLFQFEVGLPRLRDEYERLDEPARQEFLRANGVDPTADAPSRVHFEDRLRSREPWATFSLANSLAGVLVAWLVWGAAIPFAAWRRLPGTPGEDNKREAPAYGAMIGSLAALGLLALCLVLTKSRTAWLAGAVGLTGVAWSSLGGWRQIGWRLPLAAGVLGALLIGVGLNMGALDREVLTQATLSFRYRWEYWTTTSQMVADRPVLGCGPGNFQEFYGEHRRPTASETVADPHNFLLELAATGGVPAALMVGAGLVCGALGVGVRGSGFGVREAAPESLTPTSESRTSNPNAQPTWLGAFAGLLFAWPLGTILLYPAEPLAPGAAFPAFLAAGVLALLATWWWSRHGLLPTSSGFSHRDSGESSVAPAFLVGAWWGSVALGINLLAAGGIGFPGVSQSIWLLVASVLAPRSRERPASGAGAALGTLVALGLAFGLVRDGLAPVLARGALVQQALEGGRTPDQVAILLRSAAASDPRSPQPWQMLASMSLERWRRDGSRAEFEAFREGVEEATRRNRHSSALWNEVGGMWLVAGFHDGRNAAWLEESARAYARAAELNPTAGAYARWAWAEYWAGSQDRARELAEEAVRRDELHNHAELKLGRQQLTGPAGPENAEQMMGKLRNASSSRGSGGSGGSR